ncbi:MAG: hypothetical protein K2N38_14725 [Oscillospiraceae bacterium]|nr:hypothetical protein [Oscillospiraceae bacterium]
MVIDFISEHKKLVIGTVLYIAVFIAGIFFTPWGNAAVSAEEMGEGFEFTNGFMNALPLEFLYYGIAELLQAFEYIQSLEMGSGMLMFFYFTVCAVFTYTSALKHLILDGRDFFTLNISDMEDMNFFEKVTVDYLYDNVGMFLTGVLVRLLYPLAAEGFVGLWNGGNIFLNALLVFAVAVLILIPMLPNLVYMLLYALGLQKIILLANTMEAGMKIIPFFKTALIFLAAAALILLLNFLGSLLLDFFQRRTIIIIGEIGEAAASTALGFLKVAAVLIGIVFIIMAIFSIKSCIGG